jgi:outer membrane protein TolC
MTDYLTESGIKTRNTVLSAWPALLFLLVLGGATAIASEENPIALLRFSIMQADSIALENNPKIIQYNERLLEKKDERRAALGNFLPTITLNAGYTAMNDPLTMDLDPIRSTLIAMQSSTLTKIAADSLVRATGGAVPAAMMNAFKQKYGTAAAENLDAAIPHFVDTLKKKQYPSATIALVQPIFMGGKIIAAKKAAAADEQGAAFDRIRVRNEIAQETFNNYYAVALLKKIVIVRQDVVEGMLKHEKDARGLCEAGVIPRTNLLRAQVAVAEARRALADDENRLLLAKLALVKSMNLPDTSTIDITDSLTRLTLVHSCDGYLAVADSNQPLLNFIKTRCDAARAKVQVEHSAMLPRIAVFGKYELLPDYLSALEPEWAAGLTLSLDLFAGGKRYMQLSSAKHLVRETQSLLESARRDIRLWVRKAYVECVNASARYEKLIVDEALAAENLRQCRSRFESGYGIGLDVIDAELAFEKNRIDKISALYDFHRSFMDLYTAIGKSETALSFLLAPKEQAQ